MTPTDWRTLDTPEFRAAFADAQLRLDECDFRSDGNGYQTVGVENYTREMAEADHKLTDRYDRLVLQPAHAEFEAKCEQAEFEHHYPEPADGSRIEWESGDKVYGAYRADESEAAVVGSWWLYGDDKPYSWRSLIVEFEIHMEFVTLLVPAEETR
jgi:hypothetical protein